jgi:uncharacterized protein YbaR (Trm112 family)
MSEKALLPWRLDPAVLGLLACPACHGELGVDNERLVCVACGRSYPVMDGIPALLTERD